MFKQAETVVTTREVDVLTFSNSWRDFFRYGVEGGLWDLVSFLVKVVMFFGVLQIFLYWHTFVVASVFVKSLDAMPPELGAQVIHALNVKIEQSTDSGVNGAMSDLFKKYDK